MSCGSGAPLPSPCATNAFMSIRSMTPRVSCSEPIGISVATTWLPKALLSDSRARKKSARSRSSMLTKTSRASPSRSARFQRRSVWTSTPITRVDHDNRGVDHAQRGDGVGDEAWIARRVDQVDLAAVVLERGDRGADRHLALLLVGFVVGGGRPVVGPPEAVDDPGLEQERLVERRLPGAAVADQGDVANPVGGLVSHGRGPYVKVRPGFNLWTSAASAGAEPPSSGAVRPGTRSRRGPRRSPAGSGSRSSRARRRGVSRSGRSWIASPSRSLTSLVSSATWGWAPIHPRSCRGAPFAEHAGSWLLRRSVGGLVAGGVVFVALSSSCSSFSWPIRSSRLGRSERSPSSAQLTDDVAADGGRSEAVADLGV